MHYHSSGCKLLTYFLFFLYKLFGIPILPFFKLKIVKDILGILRTTCLSLHDFFSDVKQCNFQKNIVFLWPCSSCEKPMQAQPASKGTHRVIMVYLDQEETTNSGLVRLL